MSASVSGLSVANANVHHPDDPALRKGDIQGDVLIGLQKDEEVFLFFKILDAKAFKAVLHGFVPEITSTETVMSREIQAKAVKDAGGGPRLPFVGVNLGFTHPGLEVLLGAGNANGMDDPFMKGAKARAADLGDPLKNGDPDWETSFAKDVIHGVFLVTGPASDSTATSLAGRKARAIMAAFGGAVDIFSVLQGAVRPQRGHEHFGFLDGVSNPGVRGLTPRNNPADENQGNPGQDLLWPGEFVFGYPGQDPGQPIEQPGAPPPLAHDWMKDGSYMVFRRLKQLVPEFRTFLEDEGKVHGLDPQLLGARMVGRWQSGAPVMIAPLQDDPLLGAEPTRNNAFEYSQDTAGRRCPYGAHIRKTYPRDDLEDPAPGIPNAEPGVQTHRIMRQGIPFGPEVEDGENTTTKPRGLMFVCYQTSIKRQFEFVQISWANNPAFPIRKVHPDGTIAMPGNDPIIGQLVGQVGGPRTMDEIVPNYPTGATRSTLTMLAPFVVPDAAGYFFVPSIPALRDTISR